MNIIKSTGTFSIFVLISRVLGYVRDFFIALYLGSGPNADASSIEESSITIYTTKSSPVKVVGILEFVKNQIITQS